MDVGTLGLGDEDEGFESCQEVRGGQRAGDGVAGPGGESDAPGCIGETELL